MKSYMILGAIVGFLIGAGFSLMGNCPWPTALGRAGIGALTAAVLARWWSGIWLQSLHSALEKRRSGKPATACDIKPTIKL